jgi:hypothetical protein
VIKLGKDYHISPVIGVVLLVTITVVLSAVVGSFLLNTNSNISKAPDNIAFGVSDVREGPSSSPNEVILYLSKGKNIKNNEIYFSFENVKIKHEGGTSVSGSPKSRKTWRKLDLNAPPLEIKGKEIEVGSQVGFEPPDGINKVKGRKVNIIYDDGQTKEVIYVIDSLPSP